MILHGCDVSVNLKLSTARFVFLGHSNHLTPLQWKALLTEEPTSRFWLVLYFACVIEFHCLPLPTFTDQQIPA
jgi:hypothetical protein